MKILDKPSITISGLYSYKREKWPVAFPYILTLFPISHTIVLKNKHKIHGGVSPFAIGDIDSDGDNDVVTGQAWYENIDRKGTEWNQHKNIPFGEFHTYGLAVKTWLVDMDYDKKIDIIQSEADNSEGRVVWFQNDGKGNWTKHIIKDKGDRRIYL